MTLLLDVLQNRRAAAVDGGSPQWQQEWDRALEVVSPHWQGYTMSIDGEILADGGQALALALYLLSQENGTTPDQITRAQVEELLDRRGGTDGDIAPCWEGRLHAIGHDPEDPDDLV